MFEPEWIKSIDPKPLFKLVEDQASDRKCEVRREWLKVGGESSLPERGKVWAKSWAYDSYWGFEDPNTILLT